jgi:Uma2 family endonuclease
VVGESELYPDLALLKPRPDFYEERLPEASDALLVVEVADTTLRYDLSTKLPLYARAGVPEVWVVDLEGGRVLVHRKPQGEAYGEVEALGPGEVLEFMGVAVPVEALL